jgi:hypothetical protein
MLFSNVANGPIGSGFISVSSHGLTSLQAPATFVALTFFHGKVQRHFAFALRKDEKKFELLSSVNQVGSGYTLYPQ